MTDRIDGSRYALLMWLQLVKKKQKNNRIEVVVCLKDPGANPGRSTLPFLHLRVVARKCKTYPL